MVGQLASTMGGRNDQAAVPQAWSTGHFDSIGESRGLGSRAESTKERETLWVVRASIAGLLQQSEQAGVSLKAQNKRQWHLQFPKIILKSRELALRVCSDTARGRLRKC